MEKITSKNTKRVLRNRNANKTIALYRRRNYVFIVGYCCHPYTYLQSGVYVRRGRVPTLFGLETLLEDLDFSFQFLCAAPGAV